MRIITISRQFGSGGRELGKRLSDVLGYDYYDKEIITALAEQEGMDPDKVREMLASHGWRSCPLTYRNSFHQVVSSSSWQETKLLRRQREIIERIAETGNDCIIVGRDADIILQEEFPFRIYVCADMEARLRRCMRFESKKAPDMRFTEKQVRQNIRRIDQNRLHTREVLAGRRVSDGSSFDLTVNTSHWDIQKLAEAVADFSRCWFEQK